MNVKKIAENIVQKALKSGADEAEVYLEKNNEFELDLLNGDVETIMQSGSKGLGLTVFKDKRLGFSYTSDFSDNSLNTMVNRTVELSRVADPKPWNGLPEFSQSKLKNYDLFDDSLVNLTNEQKISIARQLEKRALSYDKKVTKSRGASFGNYETEIVVVNSKGISRYSKQTGCYQGVGIIAGETDDMQSGFWYSSKRHFKDLENVKSIAEKAALNALEKLGARQVPTQRVPVLFDRHIAATIWRGILRAMNGDRVFKKTTFLTDFKDKQIASPLITLIDDPTISRNRYSVPFDGEGKITSRKTIIDKGILKLFIYDTISARKADSTMPTITQRDNYKELPYPTTLNVAVKNGSTDRNEIIAGIKNGFYVKGLRNTGTDLATGTYSSGASGMWIKDGKLAFPVDGVTLGGTALDMLLNIEAVANDLDLRRSVNSPSFKISELTVGGTKK